VNAALWIALVSAVGVGSAITALLTHWLNRHTRTVDIAEKSIRVAESMMTRMQADLERAYGALEKAKQESEELRGQLAELASEDQNASLDRAIEELDQAGIDISTLREDWVSSLGRSVQYWQIKPRPPQGHGQRGDELDKRQ